MKIIITRYGIKVPAILYKLQGALIGVEFNGSFFDKSTGVSVKFFNMLNNMQGTVLKVVNNRAVIRIDDFENALVLDMIYKKGKK